jgi:hypothetical protein
MGEPQTLEDVKRDGDDPPRRRNGTGVDPSVGADEDGRGEEERAAEPGQQPIWSAAVRPRNPPSTVTAPAARKAMSGTFA